MKLLIRGSNVEITPAIKQHIEDKIAKLNKFLENPENITATIVAKVKKENHIIEITIPLGSTTLRSEETTTDLYSSIKSAVDKIERQIKKNKTRIHKKGTNSTLKDYITELNFGEEEESEETIVKRKSIELKPMSEEEAILQMNLIDHDFFIFLHDKTSNIAVIYKRKDSNYGIIETN